MSFLLDTDICSAHTTIDLMIASATLVRNLVLVTHNTSDFQNIPSLRLDDWLTP